MNPDAPPASVPATRRQDLVEEVHGVRVPDPYRWLEDETDAEVQTWMRAQDLSARAQLATLPARAALRSRFSELFYVDWISAPLERGKRHFYLRRQARQEKAVLCFKEGSRGSEQILVDPNQLSADGSVSLGEWSASWDGAYVAYALRRNAADSSVLRIRDVDAGRDLRDLIADAKYARPAWTPDSKGFYYTWLPPDSTIPRSELPGRAEIRFHALGTDPVQDVVIQPALHDPTRFLGVALSRDGRYLQLAVQRGWSATDVYFKRLPGGPEHGAVAARGFTPLCAGSEANYSVSVFEDVFYVHTNEGAPRYRLLRVDPERPARSDWHELVPESEAVLERVQVVGGRLVLTYLRAAASAIEIRELDGTLVRNVELPGIGTTEGMLGNPDTDDAYYSFTSFTQPPQIFKTSIRSGATSLWETTRVPADTSQFTVDQVFYPSRDGTRISMFLVHRKDLQRNADNPLLLTGYGGFNVSQTPSFRSTAVVWLEHGGVLAIPNLRGGGEYGETWHRAGMLENKQNVFDDFSAAAEYLIRERLTRPERLAISGGSNGGLLVGAAMTQRPELFQAVVCSVPLLDMLRYHRFGSGVTWIDEYGSSEDPGQFAALHAYSPYHRLSQGRAYPALLLLSADSDDRVDPMHARKFAAAVQAVTTSGRPVLLRIEQQAGHRGADLVRQQVERWTDEYAFLIAQLRMRSR